MTQEIIQDVLMEQEGVPSIPGYDLVRIVALTDTPSANGNAYPEEVWRQLWSSEKYQRRLSNGLLLGELDHPLDPDRSQTRAERAAVVWKEHRIVGNKVIYCGNFLSTPLGKVAKALKEGGVNLGVSLRAVGDREEVDGGINRVVPGTFELKGLDPIVEPAFVVSLEPLEALKGRESVSKEEVEALANKSSLDVNIATVLLESEGVTVVKGESVKEGSVKESVKRSAEGEKPTTGEESSKESVKESVKEESVKGKAVKDPVENKRSRESRRSHRLRRLLRENRRLRRSIKATRLNSRTTSQEIRSLQSALMDTERISKEAIDVAIAALEAAEAQQKRLMEEVQELRGRIRQKDRRTRRVYEQIADVFDDISRGFEEGRFSVVEEVKEVPIEKPDKVTEEKSHKFEKVIEDKSHKSEKVIEDKSHKSEKVIEDIRHTVGTVEPLTGGGALRLSRFVEAAEKSSLPPVTETDESVAAVGTILEGDDSVGEVLKGRAMKLGRAI